MDVKPLWIEVPGTIIFLNTSHGCILYTAVFEVIVIKIVAKALLSSVFCRWGVIDSDGCCHIHFYPHKFHFQTLTLPWLPVFVHGSKTLADGSASNYHFLNTGLI